MSKTDSKKDGLSKEDVLHIAKLANLPINEDDIEKYRKQLSETISYVENLDELNTSGVEPTSHSTKLGNVYFDDGTKNERLLTQKQAIVNSKHVKKEQFVVKRLML